MTEANRPRRAFCPGSFDPITLGHLDIIRRAAIIFDEVVVGVAADAQKQFVFTLEERLEMVREACRDIPGVCVEPFTGLLVEAAHEAGARILVKGLRQAIDLSHEGPMATMNHSLRPEIETVFLLSSPEYTYISSSLIRWVCGMGGDISAQVPAAVAQRLKERLSQLQ
jgi:pantetheine-phosphate adenylyltransferase